MSALCEGDLWEECLSVDQFSQQYDGYHSCDGGDVTEAVEVVRHALLAVLLSYLP